ncbi:serine/threonine-protein kinase [Aquisalimonas sp.]|uniref:serine/threonine-protein kinase n=1 Tax=Aquisalimonas sp. TaxID=1872621 RepID=UPI0025B9D774|nr:serine/threonine-protein kinase [Aquisalimonas sp.]
MGGKERDKRSGTTSSGGDERTPGDGARRDRDPDDRSNAAADDDRTRTPGSAARGGLQAEDAEHSGSSLANWADPERWEAPSSGPIGPGAVVKQRFVLEELLGQGGMGTVYKARDLRKEEAADSQPYVALKLLNEDFKRHPDALVALQREAKKAQSLAHPDIVTVFDFDRDGPHVFKTMEYLEGDSLDVVIRRRGGTGGLPRAQALQTIHSMARGLAYAHEKGIVHSDFKPGNVFLTREGNAKILDFGIARAARVGQAAGTDPTRFDPATLGAITPAYASAEMLVGEAPQPADDVYGLACVAYELLTGHHPFLDQSGRKLPAHEAAARRLQAPVLRNVPKRVARAVSQGLAFRREDRLPDAGAFLEMIKPPARVGRLVILTVAALVVVAAGSWWMVIRDADFLVTLDDLPPTLEEPRGLIMEGQRHHDAGDMPQAHRYYVLAWQKGEDMDQVSSRDRERLRVIVDRRTDEIVDHYIRESERDDIDAFSLELVRISLESLRRSDLGTRDDRIDDALERIDARLDEAQ